MTDDGWQVSHGEWWSTPPTKQIVSWCVFTSADTVSDIMQYYKLCHWKWYRSHLHVMILSFCSAITITSCCMQRCALTPVVFAVVFRHSSQFKDVLGNIDIVHVVTWTHSILWGNWHGSYTPRFGWCMVRWRHILGKAPLFHLFDYVTTGTSPRSNGRTYTRQVIHMVFRPSDRHSSTWLLMKNLLQLKLFNKYIPSNDRQQTRNSEWYAVYKCCDVR